MKNGNGTKKPKLVVTWHKGSATARIAYGKGAEGGGWHWQTLSAVSAPGFIDMLRYYASNFEEGEVA
jgi:hypothetical protein